MNADSAKTLKRCLSVPIIRNLPPATTRSMSAAAAAAVLESAASQFTTKVENLDEQMSSGVQETPKKYPSPDSSTMASKSVVRKLSVGIPTKANASREVSPAPFNIFAPRARRYSASFSQLGAAIAASTIAMGGSPIASTAPRLTPRISQIRQEECIDMNSREVNHEREVHNAMQMSQSWEDLTIVAENWSCKSDEMSNPLQVTLPSAVSSCSSPSPTSNRAGLKLLYGLSPSPTRRTFATRRSMSPIAMRPSQLGPVKRKFELDENSSNWNVYTQPPVKKMFTENSRGSSPICQSPSSVCPSPDSATYDGRVTPKLFISKLCTTNTTNSACSSPLSASSGCIDSGIDMQQSSLSAPALSTCSSSSTAGSEPMSVSYDEGVFEDGKTQSVSTTTKSKSRIVINAENDEATLMDDIKSDTSSICGGSVSGSESCDSVKPTTTFLNKLVVKRMTIDDDDQRPTTSTVINTIEATPQKNFFINKLGSSGAKKFVVNHMSIPNNSQNSNDNTNDSNSVSSSTSSNSSCSSRNKPPPIANLSGRNLFTEK